MSWIIYSTQTALSIDSKMMNGDQHADGDQHKFEEGTLRTTEGGSTENVDAEGARSETKQERLNLLKKVSDAMQRMVDARYPRWIREYERIRIRIENSLFPPWQHRLEQAAQAMQDSMFPRGLGTFQETMQRAEVALGDVQDLGIGEVEQLSSRLSLTGRLTSDVLSGLRARDQMLDVAQRIDDAGQIGQLHHASELALRAHIPRVSLDELWPILDAADSLRLMSSRQLFPLHTDWPLPSTLTSIIELPRGHANATPSNDALVAWPTSTMLRRVIARVMRFISNSISPNMDAGRSMNTSWTNAVLAKMQDIVSAGFHGIDLGDGSDDVVFADFVTEHVSDETIDRVIKPTVIQKLRNGTARLGAWLQNGMVKLSDPAVEAITGNVVASVAQLTCGLHLDPCAIGIEVIVAFAIALINKMMQEKHVRYVHIIVDLAPLMSSRTPCARVVKQLQRNDRIRAERHGKKWCHAEEARESIEPITSGWLLLKYTSFAMM